MRGLWFRCCCVLALRCKLNTARCFKLFDSKAAKASRTSMTLPVLRSMKSSRCGRSPWSRSFPCSGSLQAQRKARRRPSTSRRRPPSTESQANTSSIAKRLHRRPKRSMPKLVRSSGKRAKLVKQRKIDRYISTDSLYYNVQGLL